MIELKNLEKTYRTSKGSVTAIKDINITINDGEIFGIIGLSGAGKSTLVRCINYLERPTSGQVIIDGKELGIAGMKKSDAVKRAESLLELVGLSDKAKAYPSQLSGGQKQRVAIARALAAKTHYLLCDEATSALDPDTTRSVLELLKKINRTLGVTIIVITHEMKVIDSICDRVAVLDNSTVAEIGDVRTVFANPRSDIAKKLIMPQGELPVTSEHGKKIRIIYNGENSSKSLLADMILKCSTPVNILHADTKDIDGKAYGQILVQLPDDDTSTEKITAYLSANGVTYSQV